jgi:hypothetical protein
MLCQLQLRLIFTFSYKVYQFCIGHKLFGQNFTTDGTKNTEKNKGEISASTSAMLLRLRSAQVSTSQRALR